MPAARRLVDLGQLREPAQFGSSGVPESSPALTADSDWHRATTAHAVRFAVRHWRVLGDSAECRTSPAGSLRAHLRRSISLFPEKNSIDVFLVRELEKGSANSHTPVRQGRRVPRVRVYPNPKCEAFSTTAGMQTERLIITIMSNCIALHQLNIINDLAQSWRKTPIQDCSPTYD